MTLIDKLGVPLGLFVIVLILGAKKVWCFGYQLQEAQTREVKCQADYEKRLTDAQGREDEWRELALNGGYIARQAVELARQKSPSGRS